MKIEYQKFSPYVYEDFEAKDVAVREAQVRGELEVPPMFPGMKRPPFQLVSENAIIARNKLFNPFDPLYTDSEYAKTHGHPLGCPAMPGMFSRYIGAPQPFPKDIGDLWYYTNDGIEVRMFQNIYGGMKLSQRNAKPFLNDLTVADSNLRMFSLGSESDTYNDDGTLIYHSIGNTRECWRKITSGPKPSFTENMTEWTTYFPEQRTNTDEDYERMYKIWDNEVIAGDNTPYWEDIKVGSFLPETCSDGPITFMHLIAWQSMGTLSLFDRDELRDLEYMKKNYFRDRFGSFLDETALHYSGRNIPGSRMVFYNNIAADIIYRTVTNWIGNYGRVTKYAWRFFPFFKELNIGPLCADEFSKVPGYVGRDCDRHGSEGDIIIGKACVTGKYINEFGEHIVSIMCWGENFNGAIVQGCPMEVALPSKD